MTPDELLVDATHREHELALICFPPAGGAASFYNGWRRQLAGDPVLIAAVQPPGRETRYGQTSAASLESLAVEQAGVIEQNYCGRLRVALLGHSMGALVAWLTANILESAGHRIERLVLSAGLPPDTGVSRRISALDDDAFIDRVARLGGIPEPFLSEPALLTNLYLPPLRHDYELVESFLDRYDPGGGRAVRTPILALAGRDDRRATPEAMGRWRSWTEGGFEIESFDGGHFFIRTAGDRVLGSVLARLEQSTGDPR